VPKVQDLYGAALIFDDQAGYASLVLQVDNGIEA
jgi:hypothetical protein